MQIAMVRENNLYKVINTKGEVLSENQGNTLPWINRKDIYEGISYIAEQRSLDKDSSISSPMNFSHYGNINYSEDGIKLSNGVIINVTENNDGMTYNLTSEINGVKINSIENVDFIDDVTYSDGSIPFYSYENKIQGWFDKKGGMHCLRESLDDVLIVDVKNNNPIVKYKATDTFIINNNTLNVDDIKPTDKGYILTAKGNVMYVNANFQRVGGSYESIDDTYINEDVLIIKKNNKYSLMNTNGKIITDKQYDIIKGYDIIENENYTHSRLEREYYNKYVKETPFEEIESYIENNYVDDYNTTNNKDLFNNTTNNKDLFDN